MTSPHDVPKFSRALRGYDRSQVDDLVAKIGPSLNTPWAHNSLSAQDIERSEFSITMMGYAEDEVDNYLDSVTEQLKRSTGTAERSTAATDQVTAPASRSIEPAGQRFDTGFGRCYQISDVDAFVEHVEGALNSTLTSHEVQMKHLASGVRGYRADQVEQWLAQVIAYLLANSR